MLGVNITDNELSKLQVLCEYLFFDQYKNSASFPRFQECFGVLTQNTDVSLKKVFIDICGEKKKYITFQRFVRAFLEYKKSAKGKSLDFKNFFSYILKTVLKNPDNQEFAGFKIKGALQLKTSSCKNYDCITRLCILTNKDNEIRGLQLVYDETHDMSLTDKNDRELIMKVDLNLQIMGEPDSEGYLEPGDIRDIITHVYGTFTNKIEFLGFKCSSGKNYFTGTPRGDAFLFGSYQKKFHFLKLALKNGITMLQPSFVDCERHNDYLEFTADDINSDFFADETIYDEDYIQSISNTDELEKQVIVPLYHDDEFFKEDKHDCSGDSYCDICELETPPGEKKKDDNDSDDFFGEQEVIQEAEDYFGEDTIQNNNDYFSMENYFTVQKPVSDRWSGAWTEGLNTKTLLWKEGNLDLLFDKLKNEIKSEIEYKRRQQFVVMQQKKNFYARFIKNIKEEADPDLDKLDIYEKEFFDIILEKKTEESQDQQTLENSTDNANEISLKKIVLYWKMLAKRLKRGSCLFLFYSMASMLKALHILKRAEEDFIDNKTSLAEKLRILDLLAEAKANKKLLLCFSKKKQRELEKQQKLKILTEDIKAQVISPAPKNSVSPPQQEEEEKDRSIIEKKMKILENLIKTEPDNKEVLKKRYEDLLRRKNDIVGIALLEQQKEYIKKNKIDATKIKKEEEKKRAEKLEQERQRVLEKRKNEALPSATIISFSNIDIPPETEIYRTQEIFKGKDFTDPIFPPQKSSLCPYDDKKNEWVPPEGISLEEDLNGWDKYTWERVNDVLNTEDYQVFFEGVNDEDIIQGQLGDCYFLSAIAALCKFPKLIERLFLSKEKSAERCYGIYLRINGVWELVLVDDWVPCCGDRFKNLAFSQNNGKELWVLLLEKAWAKVNGCYAKAIGGMPHEAFDCITNAYSEIITITEQDSEKIWASLLDAKKNGFIMTSGTGGSTPENNLNGTGLIEGHAYTIIDVFEIQSPAKERLLKIRNPWGSGEWSGDWSDSSDKWTPQLRNQLLDKELDDGEFFMSFQDFIQYYVQIGISKLYADFVYQYLKYHKEEANEPRLTKVTVQEESKIYLQMHQKNGRLKLSNGNYLEPVMNYMILVDDKLNYVKCASGTYHITTIECDLHAGTYYIATDIVYRFTNPNDMHGYNITSYSSHPVVLEKETTLKHLDLMKSSLIDFAKKITDPQKLDYGLSLYTCEKTPLPCSFYVFENTKHDQTMQVNFKLTSPYQAVFYPDTELKDTKTNTLSKKIPPTSADVFIILEFGPTSQFGISYNFIPATREAGQNAMIENNDNESNSKKDTKPHPPHEEEEEIVDTRKKETVSNALMNNNSIEEIVFGSGTKEALDNRGQLFQYTMELFDGYAVGIENTSQTTLKMKLLIDGLLCEGKATKQVEFELTAKSRKAFELKIDPENSTGEVSLQFDFV